MLPKFAVNLGRKQLQAKGLRAFEEFNKATDEVDEDNDSYPNTPIRGRGKGSRRSSKVGSRQGSRAGSRNGSAVSAGSQGSYEDDDENELLSEEGEEIDDDFLAREMEAELG